MSFAGFCSQLQVYLSRNGFPCSLSVEENKKTVDLINSSDANNSFELSELDQKTYAVYSKKSQFSFTVNANNYWTYFSGILEFVKS